MKALTQRQAAILAFIERFIAENDAAPTWREIGAAFCIRSTNGVNDHLLALERKGRLKIRGGGKARAIRVVRAADGTRPIAARLAELCREHGWRGDSDPIEFLREQLAARRERGA